MLLRKSFLFTFLLWQIMVALAFATPSSDDLILQAKNGAPQAQYDLGAKYLFGKDRVKDLALGYKWALKAAEQGHLQAQTTVGWIFESGTGTNQDFKQAALWYKKAAQEGYGRAQRALGVLFEKGTGVEQDFTIAAAWYRKAADQNLPRAMVNLGNLYEAGLGVEQNHAMAFRWYKKSTLFNYPRGETHLALLYEKGLGVPQNLEQAKIWYSIAAKKGYLKAKKLLNQLEQDIKTSASPAQSKKTENVSKTRKPQLAVQKVATKVQITNQEHIEKMGINSSSNNHVPTPTTPAIKESKLPEEHHKIAQEKALEITRRVEMTHEPNEGNTENTILSLSEVVSLARKQNHRIMAEKSNWRIKLADVERAQSIFEPELVSQIGHEDRSQRNSIEEKVSRQFQSTFSEQNTDYGINVEGLAPTGAHISVGSNLQRMSNSFTKSLTNEDSEYKMFIGGTITQPLLKNRGIEITKAQIQVAQANADMSFQEYRQEMMRVIAEAVSSFWDLYFAQQTVSLRENSVRMASQILQDNQKRFKAGKMAELEVLEADAGVSLRKAMHIKAQQKLIAARNKLQTLLGTVFQPGMKKIEVQAAPSFFATKPDQETIIKNALILHPEYQLNLKKLEGANIQLRYARNQKWPQLDLKASYGLNGLDFSSADALTHTANADYDEWSIGLELRIPLQGGKKDTSEFTKAQEEKKRALLEIKEVEIKLANLADTAVLNISNAAEQVHFTRSMVDIKKRILDMEIKRLEAGKSDSRSLFDKEEDYLLAQETALENIVSYQRALLELKMAEGSLLQEYGIDIMEGK